MIERPRPGLELFRMRLTCGDGALVHTTGRASCAELLRLFTWPGVAASVYTIQNSGRVGQALTLAIRRLGRFASGAAPALRTSSP